MEKQELQLSEPPVRSESRLVSLRGYPPRLGEPLPPARTGDLHRRYLANASTHSANILQKMLGRLQTYRTFQPILATNNVYQKRGDLPSPTDLVEVIDRALDATNDVLLAHNINEHFIATMERTVREPTPKKPRVRTTLIEQNANAASQLSGVLSHSRSDKWNRKEAFADAWARDHPHQSARESRHHSRAWMHKQASGEHSLSKKSIQILPETASASQDTTALFSRTDGHPAPGQLNMESVTPGRWMAQRTNWVAFSKGEQSGQRGGALRPPAFPWKIVTNHEEDHTVSEWITGGWRALTHRHEQAAVLIQQTYRAYVAKCILVRRRYARQLSFLRCCEAEEKAMREWDIAVNLSWQELRHSQSTKHIRAVEFFFNCVNAKVNARRARRKAEAEAHREIVAYAATTIQRVFRGHCGRERVRGILDPRVHEAKRMKWYTVASVRLQALWRGALVRHRLSIARVAVCILQRAYRSYAARRQVAALRAACLQSSKESVRQYAATVIQHVVRR